jgi:hypothetical protein
MSKKDFEVLFKAMVIATASISAVVGGALTLTGMVYYGFGEERVYKDVIMYFGFHCPDKL